MRFPQVPLNRLIGRLATAALLLCAGPAAAETYRMDLIVFLDKSVAGEAGRAPQIADAGKALTPDNTAALAAAGITILPDEQFGLQQEWQRLRNARRYQPLIRLAWTQRDPPPERGPALRLRLGQTQNVLASAGQDFGSHALSPVEGSVALLLNRYLMLDADLIYTAPVDGGYTSYALRERRRMKRDELHHLDSPKLGVIARVSKPAP